MGKLSVISFSICLIVCASLQSNVKANINASDVNCLESVPRKPAPVVSVFVFFFFFSFISLRHKRQLYEIDGLTPIEIFFFFVFVRIRFNFYISSLLAFHCVVFTSTHSTNVKTFNLCLSFLSFAIHFSVCECIEYILDVDVRTHGKNIYYEITKCIALLFLVFFFLNSIRYQSHHNHFSDFELCIHCTMYNILQSHIYSAIHNT